MAMLRMATTPVQLGQRDNSIRPKCEPSPAPAIATERPRSLHRRPKPRSATGQPLSAQISHGDYPGLVRSARGDVTFHSNATRDDEPILALRDSLATSPPWQGLHEPQRQFQPRPGYASPRDMSNRCDMP